MGDKTVLLCNRRLCLFCFVEPRNVQTQRRNVTLLERYIVAKSVRLFTRPCLVLSVPAY